MPTSPLEQCLLPSDDQGRHFAGFFDTQMVCVASVFQESGWRLRKFATLPEFQGHGVGTQVLRTILDDLSRRHRGELFWCDARLTAMGFYHRFGLQEKGDQFVKRGVKYVKMYKVLTRTPK